MTKPNPEPEFPFARELYAATRDALALVRYRLNEDSSAEEQLIAYYKEDAGALVVSLISLAATYLQLWVDAADLPIPPDAYLDETIRRIDAPAEGYEREAPQ